MPPCNIGYIPYRLHSNDREADNQFVVGERLYMRCNPDVIDNPYKGISITELSHNRSGAPESILCNPDDVLWSIREDEPFEKYQSKAVCILRIIDLNQNNQYDKTFEFEKNGVVLKANMKLLHEPESCMFPHCVFRVWYQGNLVTYENYKATLEKAKEIKMQIKSELASMIFLNSVSQISDNTPQ